LLNQHLEHASFESHFTDSDHNGLSIFVFFYHLWTLNPPIAIVQLSIFDPESMDHCITVKPMMALVLRKILCIWSIPQVNAVDIIGNLASNNLGNLVRLFRFNRAKVTTQDWVWLPVNALGFSSFKDLLFKECLKGCKKHPETNIVERVQHRHQEHYGPRS